MKQALQPQVAKPFQQPLRGARSTTELPVGAYGDSAMSDDPPDARLASDDPTYLGELVVVEFEK